MILRVFSSFILRTSGVMELCMRDVLVLWLCFLFTPPSKLGWCDGLRPKLLCREEERGALLSFKRSLQDPSNRLSSWASDHHECCRWEGVSCHNTTGHVLKLNLRPDPCQNGSVGGEISSALVELKHLRHLYLSCNDFGGLNIPKFLGSISNLRYLDLSTAGFGGAIPSELGNLSRLQYLDIGGNNNLYPREIRLYAHDVEWISRLTFLETLRMQGVNLSRASKWLQVMNKLPSLSKLDLSGCVLHTHVGSLPLVNLSSLAVLDISYNVFTSSSLDWLAHLNSLVSLGLSDTFADGPIELPIRNMTKLKFLDLSYTNWAFPIRDWLYHMTTIEHLDLSNSNLEGKIPSDIGNLTSITDLDLSYNAIEGDNMLKALANICIFQLAKLSHHRHGNTFKYLSLRGNKLTGHFPDTLGECKSLETLDLGGNHFSGQIPVSLGGMSSLTHLYMGQNLFEGIISEQHLAGLTSLEILDIYPNPKLSFQLSSNWTPPFQLRDLYLGSCLKGPQFPAWLQTQKNLERLDISNAGISDAIPAWFWPPPSQFVDLSYNQITGSLPQISSILEELHLSNNKFSGSLSPALCSGKSGVISSLSYLDVSNNLLSGELPDCWMYWTKLQVINLENNRLSGGIPSSMGSLQLLNSLHLRNNQLSGILPPSMQNCTNLAVVDLANNELSGSIPMWMGNLTGESDNSSLFGLRVLVLRSNKFTGDIPVELCNLSHSLQILDLALNRLSGAIPPCFGNFTPMSMPQNSNAYSGFFYRISDKIYMSIDEVILLVMKSVEYEIRDNLALLTSIDLSCNNLSGEIPSQLTNLHGLILLNLSNNNLQGQIPPDVGAMKSLESLDLSVNNLSGAIPQSIASISFLSYLNLSYNNLSGRIPSGTQIRGFEPSSFTGNNGLTGPPLTEDGPGDDAPPSEASGNANQQHHEDEDEWMEMKWFYMSLPLGFVVGFWAVLGPLLFNKRWRHSYFKFLDDMKYRILGWM